MLTATERIAQAPSAFESQSFRRYYAGQAFSYFGDALRRLAIPLLVFHLSHSALSVGITYALEYLPFTIFGLVGGSLADRLDRRRLMIACDFVRFVVLVFFAVAFARQALTLWMIYAGIVVIDTASAVFVGGQTSSIPFLLGKDRATKAVASLVGAETLATTVGPMLGGTLFKLIGPLPSLVVNALTYLVSQLTIASIPTLGPDGPSALPSARQFWSDIVLGFRFAWQDSVMRFLTLSSMLFNACGMMTMAVLIPFLKTDFGANDAVVGLFIGISGIGMLAGTFLAERVARKYPFGKALSLALTLDAFIFMPIAFTHNLWLALACFTLSNLGAGFEVTQIVSWRLRVVPEEKVGRVFGAVRFAVLIGAAPAALLGGALAQHSGARFPILISALVFFAIALVAAASRTIREDVR